MARSAGLALLLAVSLLVAACGWEQQKQAFVRTVSAAALEHFVSVQRCATLTQGSVKSTSPLRPAATPSPAVRDSLRTADPARICGESKQPKVDHRYAEADMVKPHRRSTCAS